MEAEIITIGDELLIGQTVDTNSAWLGNELSLIGITLSRKTSIADKESAIIDAIKEAHSRVNLVIITGGLGPTKDDITKKALCRYYDCDYRIDESVIKHLEKIFANRSRKLLESNLTQSNLPSKSETLLNEVGTAPGMWFHTNDKFLISLPGVPSEVYHITKERVIPKLLETFKLPIVLHRTLVTLQKPESLLSAELEEFENELPPSISLAYLPSYNMVKLRLTQKVEKKEAVSIDLYYKKLIATISKDVFCAGDRDPASHLAQYFIKNRLHFTSAESCTGGLIVQRLMQEPGISSVYSGSIVAYSNETKIRELGISASIIETHGAVSESCARAMAESVRKKFNADISIASTGIAGPTGGSLEKPIGLVFIAICNKDITVCESFKMFGTRTQIMQRTTNASFWMLKKLLAIPID